MDLNRRIKLEMFSMGLLAICLAAAELTTTGPASDQWSLTAPNGLTFGAVRDYPRWKLVSSHYRTDKKEIHLIFGNPVAMDGYAGGAGRKGKPFPEGTTLVKIGYSLQENPDFKASVEPDVLQRVEYITKNSSKFKDTGGWGYARFVYDAATATFSPYGRDASFANECFACHSVVAKNDFIFTKYTQR